jgi:hypothetical protein
VSSEAIKQVVQELQDLPESVQQLVLDFLHALKTKAEAKPSANARRGRNSALRLVDGALVFTGEVGAEETDWLRIVRDEREQELVRLASAGASRP